MESVLDRYIPALSVVGGALIGALAAYADLTGALGTGTGILLTTMIIYNLYEQIAMQHMEDMHPALRRIME
jgi:preprotein translocase subunit SecY